SASSRRMSGFVCPRSSGITAWGLRNSVIFMGTNARRSRGPRPVSTEGASARDSPCLGAAQGSALGGTGRSGPQVPEPDGETTRAGAPMRAPGRGDRRPDRPRGDATTDRLTRVSRSSCSVQRRLFLLLRGKRRLLVVHPVAAVVVLRAVLVAAQLLLEAV